MIRDLIIKSIDETGQMIPIEIIRQGIDRRVFQREVNKLVEAGIIVAQGTSRDRVYIRSAEANPIDESITLPDLPDSVLLMMGYTNRRPLGAYKVQGVLSRGFE
jgi:hypothetical protein